MYQFSITLLLLLSFTSWGNSYAAKEKGKYCQKMLTELSELQEKEMEITGENGKKLIELQGDYDKTIANYTIYKGIDELRNNYLEFNDEVSRLNLGDKKEEDEFSTIKNFYSTLFGEPTSEKIKDLQDFRQDIRDGMSATAGILQMEEMLDHMMDDQSKGSLQKYITKKGMNFDGKQFITSRIEDCDEIILDEFENPTEKKLYSESELCQGLFELNEKADLVEKDGTAREMVIGFFDTYKIIKKNSGDKEKVMESLKDYKSNLLRNMPNSGHIKEQLALVKLVDEQVGLKFDNYRTTLKTNPNYQIPKEELKVIMSDVGTYFEKNSELSQENDALLGAKERAELKKSTVEAKFKSKFGDISSIINDLGKDVDKKHADIIGQMLGHRNMTKKRRELAYQYDLESNYGNKNVEAADMYNELFNELGTFEGASICGEVNYTKDIAIRKLKRDKLYKCLKSLGEITENDPISERISLEKKQSADLLSKIKEIEGTSSYENINFLKEVTADNYKRSCGGKEEKQCKPQNYREGFLSDAETVTFLLDDTEQIIADLGKGLKNINDDDKQKRLEELCEDKDLAKLAASSCRPASTFKITKEMLNDFRFSDGIGKRDGHKSSPEKAPSNIELFVDSMDRPINEISNFYSSYSSVNDNIDYMTNQAIGKKTYNYAMEQRWEQWYNNPTAQTYGVGGMFPNFYNPYTTNTFGYGSTGMYFGNTGYDFGSL